MRKLFFILILVSLIGLAILIFLNKPNKPVEEKPKEITNTKIIISSTATPQKNPTASLSEILDKDLINTKGTFGIAIKNLNTGESYYLNEHKSFESASLYKIWVLATAFNQIEKGVLKEEQILSQEIPVLNKKFLISSESAELTEGVISMTVKDAMEKMITISHNYAALLLSEKLRLSNVTAFLQNNGLKESALGIPPKTTASDVALFFEKLYQGKLVSQESTNKMLIIFKKQMLNSKLPKYLPKDTVIAHKTGELGNLSHDAGIVFTPNGDYIIAVLSETDSPAQANEKIADISLNVFQYFNKKSRVL